MIYYYKCQITRKVKIMTYNEAMAKFNNSRRELAKALDVSTQAISKWGKQPDKPIPYYRAIQIEHYFQNKV